MGMSSDAILYYGFELGSEEDGVDFLDYEERIERLHDLSPPEVEYCDSNKELYTEYFLRKRQALDSERCDIRSHCSSEFPVYYVTIKDLHVTAHLGYQVDVAEIIRSAMLSCAFDKYDAELRKFCERMDIPYKQPSLHLASDLG